MKKLFTAILSLTLLTSVSAFELSSSSGSPNDSGSVTLQGSVQDIAEIELQGLKPMEASGNQLGGSVLLSLGEVGDIDDACAAMIGLGDECALDSSDVAPEKQNDTADVRDQFTVHVKNISANYIVSISGVQMENKTNSDDDDAFAPKSRMAIFTADDGYTSGHKIKDQRCEDLGNAGCGSPYTINIGPADQDSQVADLKLSMKFRFTGNNSVLSLYDRMVVSLAQQ